MDIISLTTLLVKLEDGREHLINYDPVNHKIYPSDLLNEDEAETLIRTIRQELDHEAYVPDPNLVEQQDMEDLVDSLKNIENIENMESQGVGDDS